MGLYRYIDNPKFADSQHYFEVAAAVSRAHRDKLNAALLEYGDHGPLVSGVGRDHFPEDVKEELRSLAREVHDMNEKDALQNRVASIWQPSTNSAMKFPTNSEKAFMVMVLPHMGKMPN